MWLTMWDRKKVDKISLIVIAWRGQYAAAVTVLELSSEVTIFSFNSKSNPRHERNKFQSHQF
jgi:hypothetical protein